MHKKYVVKSKFGGFVSENKCRIVAEYPDAFMTDSIRQAKKAAAEMAKKYNGVPFQVFEQYGTTDERVIYEHSTT